MMRTLTLGKVEEKVQLSEEQFKQEEETHRQVNKGLVSIYSACAIAIHIVLCVKVFSYENTASQVCSIVASGLFMVQHWYNHGFCCLFNLFCSLPVCITGFALSNLELINTLAFIFQLCLWLGEHQFRVILISNLLLLKKRPRVQPGTVDQNNGRIVIQVDGFQFSNTQQQEIKNDLNELAGLLHNGIQQMNQKQKLQQQELAENQNKSEQNPTQQN
ncbi:unnamed protein product [Paramecium sonneborni]|uniref:Uncharacterized protein n=1 Tax=Paramecium sonneborni TaxID=65129 RepID=A0A8S1R7Z7_9CILI|nr:unnamed protein product [Paramecium sonneborni]